MPSKVATPTITQSPASGATLGLGTTTITLTATDGSGNTATCTVNQTVIDATAPTITVCASTPSNIPANNSCQGTAPNLTGSVTATDNCTSSPTITQSPASGATLGLGTTTITLTATDGSGNTATCTVNQTVIDATAPTITVCASTPTDIIGNASNQGTAPNLVGGVTATDNCTSSPTITQSPASGATLGLGTTTITLTATDGSGNTATCTVNQTVVPPFYAMITSQTNVDCNGASTGSISVSGIGGVANYDFAWSNGAVSNGSTTNSNTAIGLAAGTYTVTITDGNSLTATTSATITEPTALIAASVVDSNTTCNGFSDGGATASATGGTMPYTYTWSNSATNASITGVLAGTYDVTITDANGCTSTSAATITEPAALVAATVVDSNISCNTYADGGATASATGGTGAYSYAWSNSATNASITGIVAGTYSVTITDANGCTSTSSAAITQPTALIAAAVVDSNVTCNGSSDGGATVSATGGTAPFNYSWTNSATTASITGVAAGSYSVVITDANGCSASTSATITEPAALVAATVTDSNVTCNGFSDGGATASATGGTTSYNYAWSNGATTASITGVMAGAYTVTITDANGCTSAQSVSISEPTAVTISTVVDSNVTCFAGTNGGVTAALTQTNTLFFEGFESYTGAASYSSNSVLNGLSGVSYETSTSQGRVRIPAGTSYVRTGSYSVTLDASPSGASPDPINYLIKTWDLSSYTNTPLGLEFYYMDHGDEADVNDRCWIRGSNTSAWIEVHNFVSPNLADGVWHHVVINRIDTIITNAGQTMSSTFGIRFGQQDNFQSTSINASDGFTFDDISITGPVAGSATYAWSNSATTSSLTGLSAGTYTVTVTNGAGCMAVDSIVVTEPTELIASIAVDSNESCMNTMDGGLTATETGGTSGYSYLWSNGATTASITGLTAGTYSVSVSDANGCMAVAVDTIVHGLATSATETYTVCDSVVSPSGMYTWTTSGIYMDTLVNSIGCDSVITTNLTVNNSTSSTQVITSCDSYTSPSGFFVWTVSGIYTDLVTNAAGCDSTITFDLTISNSTDSTITVEACNEYNGVSGNQNWVTSGVYTDVIPNAAGCDSIVTVNLTINNSAMVTQNPEICNGDSIQVGSNWYTMEGTYVDTLTTMTGCDSIVTTLLDVEMVNVSVTDFNGTLRADNDFATSFQWINCDSNEIVAGEIGQLFTPTVTGNYAVVVNSINCVDTSDCYFVDLVGINDLTQNIQIAVYPNPVGAEQGTVLIEVANTPNYNIVIRDLTGKMVYSQNEVSVMQTEIDITEFAAGTFFIEIQTEQGSTFTKLVVM